MIYSKKDLLNEINAYIEVLKHDIKMENDRQAKQVLKNVVYSLEEIVNQYREEVKLWKPASY